LPAARKAFVRQMGARLIGAPLDGRAGLHVYFLLRALERLADGGRLAFILPADTCEGVFAPLLWRWITRTFCLDAIITFAPEASPFPRVDTNALIVLVRKAPPDAHFRWARVQKPWTNDLKHWAISGFAQDPPSSVVSVVWREVAEGLATGLSRPPLVAAAVSADGGAVAAPDFLLSDYARVVRGIATGANEFFFLTREQADRLALPGEFLLPAIGRTRDADATTTTDETITAQTLTALAVRGRPTLLLSLPGRAMETLPESVIAYLRQGEAAGLPQRALIAQRRPWYKMEVRAAPPFLFAYLGRRSTRFLRNTAGLVPLTGFLCVYPHDMRPTAVEQLWQVLRHPETIANLSRVGKSYGDGAIKVEPRALERLPLPEEVVRAAGLPTPRARRLAAQVDAPPASPGNYTFSRNSRPISKRMAIPS
jgi:hypothetical protein